MMELLQHESRTQAYRETLMAFLNEYGLDGAAILAMARRAEGVRYDPGHAVLRQGHLEPYVYFLVEGTTLVRFRDDREERVVGERSAVCVLGEISYFNHTPATATVEVVGEGPAVLFRIAYDVFSEILREYPQVRQTLARIGDMRLLSQHNGFASYKMFMDMIGWTRDRFAVNRAYFPALELLLEHQLLPRIADGDRVLDVGDGPGIVSEVLLEKRPSLLDNLFIQANRLEEAVNNPHAPQTSDFSRARYLHETFQVITALQVFNTVPPEDLPHQFTIIRNLLEPGGWLLVVKLRLLNVTYAQDSSDARLVFDTLERLVDRVWHDKKQGRPLVETSFLDADLDPIMEWNHHLCDAAAQGNLTFPENLEYESELLLRVLEHQARQRLFNPDDLHFEWVAYQAARNGFFLDQAGQQADIGFYYQLYRRP